MARTTSQVRSRCRSAATGRWTWRSRCRRATPCCSPPWCPSPDRSTGHGPTAQRVSTVARSTTGC
jgi:hypothetical protein